MAVFFNILLLGFPAMAVFFHRLLLPFQLAAPLFPLLLTAGKPRLFVGERLLAGVQLGLQRGQLPAGLVGIALVGRSRVQDLQLDRRRRSSGRRGLGGHR